MPMKGDFITKIIKNEIHRRKSTGKLEDIFTTSKDVYDDDTQLLNEMAKRKKKKKRKTSVMKQVNNENASTPSKDEVVVTCVSTILPKNVKKKKKRQTSWDLSTLPSSDDNMQNIFLLNLGLNKREKTKKKKSCYSSNDELKNEYAISEAPNNNQATINTLTNSDNNINYSLLQETTMKKKRKKVKKVQEDNENVFAIPKNDEDNHKAQMTRSKTMPRKEADMMKPTQRKIAEHKVCLDGEINAVLAVNTIQRDDELYPREMCQMSFASVSAGNKPKTELHATSEANKLFKCDVCDRIFDGKTHLRIHYRTHTGERPYSCDVCAKSFAKSSTLVTHNRTHTGERPYPCNFCRKSFVHSSALDRHLVTHTYKKPYACDVCGKSFTRTDNLGAHYRTHTGEKPYSCDVCGKSFAQNSNLTIHYRTHIW